MSSSSSLTVIVPRLLERPLPIAAQENSADDSLIARVAGRGAIARRWHARNAGEARLLPWQRGLLAALRLDEAGVASAPVCALGQGSEQTGGDWLHAEPIHLVAGLNEVTLVPLQPDSRLTADERDALTPTLQAHVAAEDWSLRPLGNDAWLVGTAGNFAVSTVTAEFARRADWTVALPHGPGAGRVRRVMTEMQMLLHEHPVNEARAARGLPVVNSLWLWGGGQAVSAGMDIPSACAGDSDYLRGLCRLNAWQAPLRAISAAEVLALASAGPATVCVLDEIGLVEFERHWLMQFVEALRDNRFQRLELIVDEWLITIDRWRLRRFWRRNLPLQSWAAA